MSLALMDPFQHVRQIQKFKRRLGMHQAGANCSGNIWFFVEENVDVEILSDTAQQITLKLFLQEHNLYLITTLVYAKCDEVERMPPWDSIYQLAGSYDMPWMVGGDFNVVMNDQEKIGGVPIVPQDYEDFAFCINSCDLFETGFKGSPFTWWNSRAGDDCIFERLNIIFFNSQFQQWFGHIEVEHLSRTRSDHAPLLITLGYTWFSEGDRNTRFFHNLVNGRRKRLQVNRIQISDGEWIEDKEQLAAEEINFFQQQFSQEEEALDFGILKHIPQMVSSQSNDLLCALPFPEEVKNVVFELKKESACGLDGLSGTLFHSCWDIEGKNVFRMVQAFYEGHTLPKSVTRTNLVLIPKESEVHTFGDLRPISLSNFINKVISKVVHGGLDKILPGLISSNQSGFVKGRSIIENVLLTQEIVTDIRKRGKPTNVVIKLDMAKTYDRVSWLYLTRVLKRKGFTEIFVDQIWRLLANNWYLVLLNG
ncbi:uncharacterized protein LOC132612168 [Lycium barbarum]|uniref:uncharacterized protein LOC132612168 n=1 Tax=Lycium barbarum TaxID=112863 RepID=UPI00293ED8A7|nr:uncharacterized protein LOC132612168 [Lycium barbarum]